MTGPASEKDPRSSPSAFETPWVKATVATVVVVALVALGVFIPWGSASRVMPALAVDNQSLSANFNFSSASWGAPNYDFGAEALSSDFSEIGSGVNSSLTLNATGFAGGFATIGFDEGFAVNITGSVDPNLDPSAVRFVLTESVNSTIHTDLIILPNNGYASNVSDIDTAWEAQGNNGSTTQTVGPGSVALVVDLENQTQGDPSDLTASYHFAFTLLAEGQFVPDESGQTTYSLFAILQGLSQLVYCAMTIQVDEFLR
jgi:hypothetical protein